jgi:hypothetical protein
VSYVLEAGFSCFGWHILVLLFLSEVKWWNWGSWVPAWALFLNLFAQRELGCDVTCGIQPGMLEACMASFSCVCKAFHDISLFGFILPPILFSFRATLATPAHQIHESKSILQQILSHAEEEIEEEFRSRSQQHCIPETNGEEFYQPQPQQWSQRSPVPSTTLNGGKGQQHRGRVRPVFRQRSQT